MMLGVAGGDVSQRANRQAIAIGYACPRVGPGRKRAKESDGRLRTLSNSASRSSTLREFEFASRT
jgi:hypothetical protein